jgi:SAM-dependent methyltransferase
MDPYKTTFDTYNKIAALYQEVFMDLDLYDDTYDRFCELLPSANASVLEIGCGPGNVTRYLLRKRPDLHITAIDMAPAMLELAKTNNPAIECLLLDCRAIGTIGRSFDAVLNGFCMPYLSQEDCVRLFTDAAALMPSGGVFYGSAIEGDYARSGFETGSSGDSVYVYYHDAGFLTKELEAAGFHRIETIRKAYGTSAGTDSVHLILIAQKK